MSRRFVVTGGSGFIGSNFLHRMVKQYPDDYFVNVDKLTYSGNPQNTRELENKKNYSFQYADICDKTLIEKIIFQDDIIVNFAAETHVDNSISDPNTFLQTNVFGTQNLLNIAREKRARLFLQISTDEVYGSLSFIDRPSKETDNYNPSSPYSASKASAEMLCIAAQKTYGQPIMITRSSNNFGPRQFPEKMIPLFITNLKQGKKVPLYGDGSNIRDWIYVDDNCKALDFIIKKGKIGEVYNIGGGNELSNIQLTSKILEEMGLDSSYIQRVEDRPGHDLRYSLDCSKIKDLGYVQKNDFSQRLKDTIKWYEENKEWWEKLKNIKGKRTS